MYHFLYPYRTVPSVVRSSTLMHRFYTDERGISTIEKGIITSSLGLSIAAITCLLTHHTHTPHTTHHTHTTPTFNTPAWWPHS